MRELTPGDHFAIAAVWLEVVISIYAGSYSVIPNEARLRENASIVCHELVSSIRKYIDIGLYIHVTTPSRSHLSNAT